MESTRHRKRQGSFRRSQVGEVFRSVVDTRRQRIFLQPLRRTEGRHLEGHQLFSKSLLPQTRLAAVGRCARLRTSRSERLALRRQRYRRRQLPDHHSLPGNGREENKSNKKKQNTR